MADQKQKRFNLSRVQPFEDFPQRYEDWFRRNKYVYQSELEAVRSLLPETGLGVEIGVGTGRFAVPLAVKTGVEPSRRMREIAERKGLEVVEGFAEKLPFKSGRFDFALMVTTVCFVNSIEKAFQEAYRVIKKDGCLIVGFIDKNSRLGKMYQNIKEKSVFYKVAEFFSVDEIIDNLRQAGFKKFDFSQTLFRKLRDVKKIEPVKPGCGQGSFVVIRAAK